MKQKWKFHQRWRRRYFRLKGHKLYYSKDADEVSFVFNSKNKFIQFIADFSRIRVIFDSIEIDNDEHIFKYHFILSEWGWVLLSI